MTAGWPWFAIAGLGVFHGLNPAMGWLFAVALGLHRGSRRTVLLALPPIAAGHAASVLLVAMSVMALGLVVNSAVIRVSAGGMLILWAGYDRLYGHRHRVRVGLTAQMAGLALWSFMMATAHGAGLMLVPALLPLCAVPASGAPAPDVGPGGLLLVSLAAVAVHTAAALAITAVVALLVFEWIGLEVLRRGWINFDLLWTGALIATGLLLIVTA